jgi:hypothetical protein
VCFIYTNGGRNLIEIPLKVKNPTLKYKIFGVLSMVIGLGVFGYSLILGIFGYSLINYVSVPLFLLILLCAGGLLLAVVGLISFILPSLIMVKYFFNQISRSTQKQLHPLFALPEFVDLYEAYGRLYYILGDYKRSEIFYGVMVILKQQQVDPTFIGMEVREAQALIKKLENKGKDEGVVDEESKTE